MAASRARSSNTSRSGCSTARPRRRRGSSSPQAHETSQAAGDEIRLHAINDVLEPGRVDPLPGDEISNRRQNRVVHVLPAKHRPQSVPPAIQSSLPLRHRKPRIVRQVIGPPHEGIQDAHVAKERTRQGEKRQVELRFRPAGEIATVVDGCCDGRKPRNTRKKRNRRARTKAYPETRLSGGFIPAACSSRRPLARFSDWLQV